MPLKNGQKFFMSLSLKVLTFDLEENIQHEEVKRINWMKLSRFYY